MNNASELVINPLTQRPIKIGGRVYKKLIIDGYIPSDDKANKYKLKEDTQTVDNNYKSDSEISIIDYNECLDEDANDAESGDYNGYEDDEEFEV
jgi:hypothetical protein